MNTFSMESVFLILSGVIFMAGILYWFWSHIQLTQKKVLLLESAVFELRSQMTRLPDTPYKPAYTDLADDWEEDATGTPNATVSAPAPSAAPSDSDIPEDLRPGGHVSSENDLMDSVSSQVEVETGAEAEASNTQFRELFVNENSVKTVSASPATATTTATATPESLDSMSLKELRRLAEQRGIPNPNELRKKEILSALRNQITLPVAEVNVVQLQETDAVPVTEILE